MQSTLLLPVHGLDVGSLDQEEREHLKMAVVGSVMESRLPRTITNVQVTKMRDENLCTQTYRRSLVLIMRGHTDNHYEGAVGKFITTLSVYAQGPQPSHTGRCIPSNG